MFVQVFRGRLSDPDAMRERHDVWVRELQPGAEGFLGATMGTTAEGIFVNVVRFESEEHAQRNASRPEQGAWWAETEPVFAGPVSFYNCPRVSLMRGGGSDDAGFVQVMTFRPSDVDRVVEMNDDFEKAAVERADLIGGLQAVADDGTVIQVVYFSSEAEARAAEAAGRPSDMQSVMEEFMQLAGDVEYLDLTEPVMLSA